MQYALFLDEIRIEDAARVGSKAATLARLSQLGLPVPPGFVVPADLFDLAAEPTAQAPLRSEADQPPEGDPPLSGRLATALADARLPPAATDALRRAFDVVANVSGAVVVRSSAIGEDLPTASAAGQYETMLNVRDFPAFLAALRRCWASLFSPAALEYRRRRTGDVAPRMAVLVQAQVPCEVAGTLFTANPITGREEIVIEATWGLGEAIAQGEVVPDRFVVDPLTLAELPGTRVAEKTSQRVPDRTHGTRLIPVPAWRRRVPTLDRSERGALSLLGLRVAEALGAPQDLEWGRSAGRWWIFQARPITTSPTGPADTMARAPSWSTNGGSPAASPTPGPVSHRPTPPGEGRTEAPARPPRKAARPPRLAFASYRGLGLGEEPPTALLAADVAEGPAPGACARWDWTSGFLDERLVEPVSPLGWSVLRAGLEEIALGEPLRMLGVDPDSLRPLTRLWNGHPYANVAVFEALYKLFPDWLLPEDARRFFPGGDVSRRKRAPRPRGLLEPGLWLRLARAFLRDPAVVSPLQNDLAWERFVPRYETAIAALARRIDEIDASPAPRLGEVLALLDALDGQNRALLRIHRWSLTYAELWYSLLRRAATALVGPGHGDNLAVLAVARLNDQSMRLNQSLAELRRLLAAGSPPEAVLPGFLREYGHRSFSLDILRPPFAADPSQVLALVDPPGAAADRSVARRARGSPSRAPDRSAGAGGPSGFVSVLLRPLIGLARRYARLRENQRFAWQRGLAQARRLYLVAGRVLAGWGAVNRAEDVFFLTADEVRRATPASDFHAVVATRFEALAAQQDLFLRLGRDSYPPFLHGNQPMIGTEDSGRLPRSVSNHPRVVELQGVPVSPGVGRGRARIILRASDLPAIRPGEILVARGADPGWTAIFERLAGLVAESGGQLSHASVVAREFRLPAVVAVPRATDLIHTGDEVEVDGRSGVVRVTRRGGNGR